MEWEKPLATRGAVPNGIIRRMELWIPITIFAAFMQNLRSALQKYLKGRLSTSGATFSRFAYAAPLAALYLAGLARKIHERLPPNPDSAL